LINFVIIASSSQRNSGSKLEQTCGLLRWPYSCVA